MATVTLMMMIGCGPAAVVVVVQLLNGYAQVVVVVTGAVVVVTGAVVVVTGAVVVVLQCGLPPLPLPFPLPLPLHGAAGAAWAAAGCAKASGSATGTIITQATAAAAIRPDIRRDKPFTLGPPAAPSPRMADFPHIG